MPPGLLLALGDGVLVDPTPFKNSSRTADGSIDAAAGSPHRAPLVIAGEAIERLRRGCLALCVFFCPC